MIKRSASTTLSAANNISMNYIFFGSPRFAAIILEHLIGAGMPPTALVTNPDRPVGRKQAMTPPATKIAAQAGNPSIKIFHPETLDEKFLETLKAWKPEFFVVAAYAKILPQAVLDIPARGTVGTHPSLLPQYRGASPIQGAILGGEKETGVTLYLMDAKMDHGPILAEERVPVADDETYLSLQEKTAIAAGKLLEGTLPKLAAGKIEPMPQNESEATFTKKFKTEDGFVPEEDLRAAMERNTEKAIAIDRKIRALAAEPGVWTMQDGKRIKLLKARIENGLLKLLETQREGEKPKRINPPSGHA